MDPSQQRGADLEIGIERFLTLHGYNCRRNAVVEGRSGGRHEIDVLAEMADGVTTYRLAVECKARREPVDKEVVAKLAYVVRDLGLHQGVVASLAGATVGAEQSARELGIELWGPGELESRLGQVALADLAAGPALRPGEALPLRCPVELAERWVRKERRGVGSGREQTQWLRLVWVPHELLQIATTELEVGRFGRPAERARWGWNLYESITGTLVQSLGEEPGVATVDLAAGGGLVLPAAVPAGRAAEAIRRAVARRDEVTTTAARARHVGHLEAMGIAGEARSVTVAPARVVAHPYYLALVTRRQTARIVAVDGHLAQRSPMMSTILTGAVDHVTSALAGASLTSRP